MQEMYSSDVFIFPTLCEGFAHVVLEAMSIGLPVITTTRCCGPDVIEEGKHGFIIPANDSKEIAGKLSWAASNKEILYDMGQAAAARSAGFTWQQFRNKTNEFYETAISN
jgi:glycosyltransferase involved in cell wall biosynthesis